MKELIIDLTMVGLLLFGMNGLLKFFIHFTCLNAFVILIFTFIHFGAIS